MYRFVFKNMKATLKNPQYGAYSNLFLAMWIPFLMDKSDNLANGFLSVWPGIMYLIGVLFFSFLPNRVSKGMYLCPCTHEDRIRFLTASMRIKFLIVMAFNVMGLLIGYLVKPYDLRLVIFEILYLSCAFTALNLQSIGFVIPEKKDYRAVSSRIYDTLRKAKEYILCYAIIIYNVLTVFILIYTTPDSNGDYILHGVLAVIDLFLTGLYVIKYRRQMLLLSSDYEAVYATRLVKHGKEFT